MKTKATVYKTAEGKYLQIVTTSSWVSNQKIVLVDNIEEATTGYIPALLRKTVKFKIIPVKVIITRTVEIDYVS